jgi:hypothetical protein
MLAIAGRKKSPQLRVESSKVSTPIDGNGAYSRMSDLIPPPPDKSSVPHNDDDDDVWVD